MRCSTSSSVRFPFYLEVRDHGAERLVDRDTADLRRDRHAALDVALAALQQATRGFLADAFPGALPDRDAVTVVLEPPGVSSLVQHAHRSVPLFLRRASCACASVVPPLPRAVRCHAAVVGEAVPLVAEDPRPPFEGQVETSAPRLSALSEPVRESAALVWPPTAEVRIETGANLTATTSFCLVEIPRYG
jgi:hypothetical protein